MAKGTSPFKIREDKGKEGGEGDREQIWDGLAPLGPLMVIFLSTEKQNVFQKTQLSLARIRPHGHDPWIQSLQNQVTC